MICCASSHPKRLAALWTGPSMKTRAEANPRLRATSSSETVAPHECPTTTGRSSRPSRGPCTGLRLARGRFLELFCRRLNSLCSGSLASLDQERRERGEGQKEDRHHQRALQRVDVRADENVVRDSRKLRGDRG